MSSDVLAGRWKQLKGRAKEKWGLLTDDDLDRIDGQHDQLVGRIQEHYGEVKEEAERQVADFIHRFLDSPETPRRSDV